MRKRIRIGMACFLAISFFNCNVLSYAYTKTGYKFDEPRKIKFFIASNASAYARMFRNTVPTWGSYVTQVSLKETVAERDGNIKLYYGTTGRSVYGVTVRIDRNHYKITFTEYFAKLSTNNKKREVILHEVGHALGLDHTQKGNYGVSIMWNGEDGNHFHNVAYPLSDDVRGMTSIYSNYSK